MANDGSSEFEYRGWLVRIETTGSAEVWSGHAELYLNGDHKCRLALSTNRKDSSSACWALDSKARNFIDDWTTRPRTGDTTFQDL